MGEKQQAIGDILNKIADELNITDTMMAKAVSSYQAVGEWLGKGIDYDVEIKPQGSMNLGTVIRPIDDSDDYDMDLVCLLKNGYNLSAKQIKQIVGNRLKENTMYQSKLEKEGKRCWTMQYEEFHMDILPCVSKDKIYTPQISTSIRLTHKTENGVYVDRFSNPEAYHKWFVDRMNCKSRMEKNSVYSERDAHIDKVPTYKRRTALQKAIQLLKRHRDIVFQGNEDNAPISIIITTLAALAYDGEANLYDVLETILNNMTNYITCRNNQYSIPNPVMSEEDFADKWNENPEKARAFYKWVSQARKDLLEDAMNLVGLDEICDNLKHSLGDAPVKRAFNKLGEESRDNRGKGALFVNGLTGTLGTVNVSSAIKVKEHTFFGV